MKNWELEQYLERVRSEFDYGNDKLYLFARKTEREAYYVDRTATQIIDEAIKYIKDLEAKVEELSYTQKIIDEVKRQDGRAETRKLDSHFNRAW